MKVKELIEKLNKVPGEADILIRLISYNQVDIETVGPDADGYIDVDPNSYWPDDNQCGLDIVVQNKCTYEMSFVRHE